MYFVPTAMKLCALTLSYRQDNGSKTVCCSRSLPTVCCAKVLWTILRHSLPSNLTVTAHGLNSAYLDIIVLSLSTPCVVMHERPVLFWLKCSSTPYSQTIGSAPSRPITKASTWSAVVGAMSWRAECSTVLSMAPTILVPVSPLKDISMLFVVTTLFATIRRFIVQKV